MLLTLDIGNTNIKSGLFGGDELLDLKIHKSPDEVIDCINSTIFEKAAICSVNPDAEEKLIKKISEKGIEIFKVNVKHKLNFDISYKTPDTLGMDRVCSVVGAFNIANKKNIIQVNQYLVTIDFGTATTINILSPEGSFVGGLIAPGISTMLKSLKEKTAQLPLPDLNSYEGVVGKSTDSSIISGVLTATTGMINEVVNNLSKSSGGNPPVIFVTGGNSDTILPHINHKIIYEKALVLKGLKVTYDLNK